MRAAVLGAGLGLGVILLAGGGAAAQPAAEEKAIRDQVARWNQMIAKRDLDGVVGLYLPDAHFMTPNAPSATGPALREAWKALLGAPQLQATLTPLEVKVAASGDLAYERGAYRIGVGGAAPDVGKYIVVWRKTDGQWKVAQDIFNSDLPAPAAK